MADVPFTDKTYYLDTSEPQLVDLLTPAEAERCVPISERQLGPKPLVSEFGTGSWVQSNPAVDGYGPHPALGVISRAGLFVFAVSGRYSHFSPRARPGTVASELTIIVQLLGTRFQVNISWIIDI